MKLAIKYVSLKSLVPYARNSKKHPAGQIAQLKASLVEFGWTRPIALADGIIIFGHGVFEAAQQLAEAGAKIPNHDDVRLAPTVDLSHLTPAQRKAYTIADNKLSERGTWDFDLLALEFSDLEAAEFDSQLTGFDSAEILDILSDPNGPTGSGSEWEGMPEFNQDDQMPQRSIAVHFSSEKDVAAFAKLVKQTITDKTKFIWYPKAEKLDTISKTYGE